MKMYGELAAWWPLVSAPEDYLEEATEYVRLLRAAATRPLRAVLELGSGGGNNASHMKRAFAMTLVEPSDGMRAVSVALNPDCEHLAGDMRTVRLGREFDAVFVHDAVTYMASEADLLAAFRTVAAHLVPGGVALVCPDGTAETYEPGASLHGHDAPDGRGIHYVEWMLPAAPGATQHETHYNFLVRERDGTVRAVHDVHVSGLFPRETWLRLLAEAGLRGRLDTRHLVDPGDGDVFVAVKPE